MRKIKSILANFEPNFKKIQILLITLQSAWSGKKPCHTTVTLITLFYLKYCLIDSENNEA